MHARLLRPITINHDESDSSNAGEVSLVMLKKNQCCLLLVTYTSDVPKVISINVLLLHIQSLSGQKRAGIFYSEWSVLVKSPTVVREEAGSGAEEGLF